MNSLSLELLHSLTNYLDEQSFYKFHHVDTKINTLQQELFNHRTSYRKYFLTYNNKKQISFLNTTSISKKKFNKCFDILANELSDNLNSDICNFLKALLKTGIFYLYDSIALFFRNILNNNTNSLLKITDISIVKINNLSTYAIKNILNHSYIYTILSCNI